MGIIAWVILGLLAGFFAKWFMPGDYANGFLMTTILGIAGALVGGFIGSTLFGWGTVNSLSIKSLVIAVLGAMLIIYIYRKIKY